MTYASHWLLQFGGTLGTQPGEIWSCGIRFGKSTPLPTVDEDFLLSDVYGPALQAWFLRAGSRISAGTKFTFAKFNELDILGHYADPGVTHEWFQPDGGVSGAIGSGALPFQCAVVLTWLSSERTRGPGSRGRIYSPHPAVIVDQNTGLCSLSDAQAMADSAAQLIADLKGTDFFELYPCIATGTLTEGGDSANAYAHIDSVRVDTRVDTIRRRTNGLKPTSALTPVPA